MNFEDIARQAAREQRADLDAAAAQLWALVALTVGMKERNSRRSRSAALNRHPILPLCDRRFCGWWIDGAPLRARPARRIEAILAQIDRR